MQDRIYRFLIKRSVRGGVFEAVDTVAEAPVLLYEWTPPIDQRAEARARLAGLAEGLGAEVFSVDASLYLAATNDVQAKHALKALNQAGLFVGHWAGEAPVEPAPPAAPPKPAPKPAPRPAAPQPAPPPPTSSQPPRPPPPSSVPPSSTPPIPPPPSARPDPPFTTVRAAPGPPAPKPVSRWPRSLLRAALLALLLAAGAGAVALYRDGPAKPAAALEAPRLTVEPRIAHPGERVSLNWSTAGYNRVQLDGQRIDNAGNRIVTASATRIFRLVAIAADGRTATADARLIVTPARTRIGKPNAGSPLNSQTNDSPPVASQP